MAFLKALFLHTLRACELFSWPWRLTQGRWALGGAAGVVGAVALGLSGLSPLHDACKDVGPDRCWESKVMVPDFMLIMENMLFDCSGKAFPRAKTEDMLQC